MDLLAIVVLHLGPWAAWLMPGVAATAGLAAGVLAVLRARAQAAALDATAQVRLSPSNEGRRVRLVGRLMTAGEGVPSFADGRPVAVSIARGGPRPEERRAAALLIETPEGRFPLAGTLDVQGARRRPAQIAGVGRCEVLDAPIGATVLVEGFVGRVMQESLRDPAARLGLRSERDGFFEPIRIRVQAPDVRREVAILGGAVIAACLLLVPLPSSLYDGPTGQDDLVMNYVTFTLYGTESEPTWLREAASIVRLLSPARDAELANLAEARERRRQLARSATTTLRLDVETGHVDSWSRSDRLADSARRGLRAVEPAILDTRIRREREAHEARELERMLTLKAWGYRGFDAAGLTKREGREWEGRYPRASEARGAGVCGMPGMDAELERQDRLAYVRRQLQQ